MIYALNIHLDKSASSTSSRPIDVQLIPVIHFHEHPALILKGYMMQSGSNELIPWVSTVTVDLAPPVPIDAYAFEDQRGILRVNVGTQTLPLGDLQQYIQENY